MSDENKESRVNVDDLPQGEKELTAEEAKDVAGGLEVKMENVLVSSYQSGGHEGGASATTEPDLKTR